MACDLSRTIYLFRSMYLCIYKAFAVLETQIFSTLTPLETNSNPSILIQIQTVTYGRINVDDFCATRSKGTNISHKFVIHSSGKCTSWCHKYWSSWGGEPPLHYSFYPQEVRIQLQLMHWAMMRARNITNSSQRRGVHWSERIFADILYCHNFIQHVPQKNRFPWFSTSQMAQFIVQHSQPLKWWKLHVKHCDTIKQLLMLTFN